MHTAAARRDRRGGGRNDARRVMASWLIADLADAARYIDRLDAARARVAELEATVGERPGTWIALGRKHGRALLAAQPQAGKRFEEALSGDLTRWPFQRARIELAYGQWLRRNPRVAGAGAVLRAAPPTFA